MAVNRILSFAAFLLLVAVGANAAGRLSIIHSPSSLKFTKSSETLESVVKDILSASLGLSVEETSEWNGLSILDPFSTPEAIVEVQIDGVANLGNTPDKFTNYDLIVDEYDIDTYEIIKHRIKQRFTSGENNTLISANLNDHEALLKVFGGIKVPVASKQYLQHLKLDASEDYQFLQELSALKAVAEKVRNGAVVPDNMIDFYYFRFRSLHALSDFHGPTSLKTKEAKKLLGSALQELSDAFSKAYSGSVLVAALTTDVVHTRRATRAADQPDNANITEDDYSADYAAIFNIILWFGIVFAFALIAIVYALMDMDPGRDSIIYRMTSTRIKKDN